MIKFAVQFPDGDLPGQYFYDSKKDLKEFAPVSIYGTAHYSWKTMKKDGYKIRKVEVLPIDKKGLF